MVSSAKSWLCHAGVDRKANILPWSADAEVKRISPMEATTLYLKHLRDAWNHEMAADETANKLEKQRVVLTVPASFDESARELTVEAAKEAGLTKLTLLEEPQAAFYDWMSREGVDNPLPPGATCVVVDCGGGTTDFSLIAVGEEKGETTFDRLAVGDHLLLGGDNMDVAIATTCRGNHFARPKTRRRPMGQSRDGESARERSGAQSRRSRPLDDDRSRPRRQSHRANAQMRRRTNGDPLADA